MWVGALALLALAATLAAPPSVATQCGSAYDDLQAKTFWFRSSDGVRLNGAELGRGRTGVVLANQHNDTLCSWLDYAQVLSRNGFRVLAFDFRNTGLSGRTARPRLDLDVAAASAELRRRGATRVFVVGASEGGYVAVDAGARLRPQPAGVVDISGPGDARKLHAPLLVITAESDPFLDAAGARKLVREAGSTSKRAAIFPGSWHGISLLTSAPYRARVSATLLAFLR